MEIPDKEQYYNKKITELNLKISDLLDQITIQKNQIQESINYAGRIQQVMLPSVNILNAADIDNFILYIPKDIVSGDFYWFSNINNKIIIAVGDCTGHGVPGALISVLGISYLNDIINNQEILEPDEVLSKLRKKIITSLHQKCKADELKDGMELAMVTIDFNNKTANFAGAHHPLYLVRNKELIEIKGDRMTLAAHPKMIEFSKMSGEETYMYDRDAWLRKHEELFPFKKHEFEIKKGDCLYLFSDGYRDQTGGKDGNKLMANKFREVLTMISQYPLGKQKKFLVDYLNKWKGKREQVDDILIVGIKI